MCFLGGLPRCQSGKMSFLPMQKMQVLPLGKILWSKKWQPAPVFLPGQSHGWRSLVGHNSWSHKESWWNMMKHTILLASHCHLLPKLILNQFYKSQTGKHRVRCNEKNHNLWVIADSPTWRPTSPNHKESKTESSQCIDWNEYCYKVGIRH